MRTIGYGESKCRLKSVGATFGTGGVAKMDKLLAESTPCRFPGFSGVVLPEKYVLVLHGVLAHDLLLSSGFPGAFRKFRWSLSTSTFHFSGALRTAANKCWNLNPWTSAFTRLHWAAPIIILVS